jgi:hypothetical protein
MGGRPVNGDVTSSCSNGTGFAAHASVPCSHPDCPVPAPGIAASARQAATTSDHVDHPLHYNAHPSGVECITITEHMGFNLGNAIKYIWRADLKGDAIEDLRKARWYLDREIARLGQGGPA